MPEDHRFRDDWQFALGEAADNYTIRAHWDPTYNPDIDRELAVAGFEINSPAEWTGSEESETPEEELAKRQVLVDSVEMSPDGPCQIVIEDPEVLRCSYDGGRDEELHLLVRWFSVDDQETVMVVYGYGAGEDFISGTFESVPVNEATERWLVGS